MRLFIAIYLSLLLTSCGEYKKPEPKVPASWNNAKNIVVVENTKISKGWWHEFNNKTMDYLISRALENNHDLKIAEARIKEVRAERRGISAELMPELKGYGKATRGNTGSGISNSGKTISLYENGFDASWELDIFGGTRKREEAGKALEEASRSSRDYVKITLISEVARNYIELLQYQKQLTVLRANIDNQQEITKLIESQKNTGIISDIEMLAETSELEKLKSRKPNLETLIESQKNRITTLLGEQPGSLDFLFIGNNSIPQVSDKIILGTPIDVINNRPDIKLAENNLKAASLLKEAEEREIFPKITISGIFSSQDTSLITARNIWLGAANAVMPLINFGRIRSRIKAQDARQEQAYYNYEKSVLSALEEIENSLVRYSNKDESYKFILSSLDSNKTSFSLIDHKYQKGLVSLFEVLKSKRAIYETETSFIEAEASKASAVIALYKALGGYL